MILKRSIVFVLIFTIVMCINPSIDFTYSKDTKVDNTQETSAPDFTLQDTDGNSVTLSGMLDMPVLLDFTASWCGPCQNIAPELGKLASKYLGKIHVLSVDIQEDIDIVIDFKQKVNAFWPYLLDSESKVAADYSVTAIPYFVLVDINGFINTTFTGYDKDLVTKLSAPIDSLLSLYGPDPNDPGCDWPSFGRTPEGNRVAPDECGLKGDKVKLKWKWEPYIGSITTDLAINNGRIFAGSATGKLYCIDEQTRMKVWDFATDGAISNSTPLIANGRLYFGSNDKKFYCLDEITGAKVWEFATNGPINCSSAISNGKVYFGSGDKKLYCLDAITGKKVWEYLSSYFIETTPVVSNGKVYFSSGNLYCLDAVNGKKVWDFSTNNPVLTTPAVSNNKVYFGSNDNKLYCLNAANGTKAWDFAADGSIVNSPVVNNNRIYFGVDSGNGFYCLDALNGIQVWQNTTSSPMSSAPVISNNRIYFGIFSDLCCLDATNGKNLWEHSADDIIRKIPTISNSKVYFGSDGNKIYCIDAASGVKIWDYQTGGVISTAPIVSNGKVFFSSGNSNLFCIDVETSAIVWEDHSNGTIIGSPSISNNKMYIVSNDNKLYCLDAATGAKVWEYVAGSRIIQSSIISDNKVFFGSNDNKLYCLDATNGTKSWEYETGNSIWSSPAISNEKVYFGLNDSKLYCLDATNGAKVWEYVAGSRIIQSPIISDNKVFFGSNDNKLYCLDAATGEKVSDATTNVEITSTSVFSKNLVYFINTIYTNFGSNGDYIKIPLSSDVYCLDTISGSKVWKFKADSFRLIKSIPVISNNRLYVGTDDSKLYCLDATTGAKVWDYQTFGSIDSSPAISNGMLLFGSMDNCLYCLTGDGGDTSGDTTPPTIRLINPAQDSYIAPLDMSFNLEFEVVDESNIVEVTVSGVPVYKNDAGNYSANIQINEGDNIFTILAKDVFGNAARMEVRIFGLRKQEQVDVTVPDPVVVPDSEYNSWVRTEDKTKAFSSMSFSDLDFPLPKYSGDGEVFKLPSTMVEGMPDIPSYAIRFKLPEGETYDTYDLTLNESPPLKMSTYITPVVQQLPLPVGGKPYVLPNRAAYGLMSSGDKVSSSSEPNMPNSPIVSGGNPYRWPPELYFEKTNEVVIFVNPAIFDGKNKILKRIKDFNIKIKTKPKNGYSSQATPFIQPKGLEIQEPYDMCIISNKELIGIPDGKMDDFADYAAMRSQMGVATKCFDIEDIYKMYPYIQTNYEKIQIFLMYEKQFSKIKYAILGGENEIVPTTMVYSACNGYRAIIPSDAYYSQSEFNWGKVQQKGFEGMDIIGSYYKSLKLKPDLFVGRVPVSSLQELKSYINKMNNYYKSPYQSAYNTSVMLVGNKLDSITSGGDVLDVTSSSFPDIGLKYTRLYDSPPKSGKPYINYYNSEFAASIISQTNPHMILIDCHGKPTCLNAFCLDNVDSLNNTGFITSTVSCNTNQYSQAYIANFTSNEFTEYYNEPSISEKLLFKEKGGALVYAGNTAYGWYTPGMPESGISDLYQKQFAKQLLLGASVGEAFWTSKITCYACADEDKNQYDPTDWWVYNCYNLLGDPSLTPVFYGEQSRVDRIELSPKFSFCQQNTPIFLQAYFQSNRVTISDSENIQWTWSPQEAGYLTVAGENVSFTCKGNASVLITAKYKNLIATCVVIPNTTNLKLRITPPECNLDVGSSIKFTAKITDSFGYDITPYFKLRWQVDDLSCGQIDLDGLFTMKCQGKCQVIALCEELGIGWVAYVNYDNHNNNIKPNPSKRISLISDNNYE
jgi:outer membrane protein assembly factor BamB/thiol-disulfide isomerase/thioredoxin